MTAAAHRQRLRVADVHDHAVGARIVAMIGEASEPAERLAAVRDAGVPEAHRREMREARMLVAAAVDDGHLAVFVEALEADHRRMEAEAAFDADDVMLANAD